MCLCREEKGKRLESIDGGGEGGGQNLYIGHLVVLNSEKRRIVSAPSAVVLQKVPKTENTTSE